MKDCLFDLGVDPGKRLVVSLVAKLQTAQINGRRRQSHHRLIILGRDYLRLTVSVDIAFHCQIDALRHVPCTTPDIRRQPRKIIGEVEFRIIPVCLHLKQGSLLFDDSRKRTGKIGITQQRRVNGASLRPPELTEGDAR